jgi:anti-sigma regulatory factor (Ser/Thr protein kinase)
MTTMLRRFTVDATQPAAVPTARRTARAIARGWGIDGDCLDALLLITSEAVTNTHLHAPGPVVIALTHVPDDGLLIAEFHDTGRRTGNGPAARFADDQATTGRGLALLIDHLTGGRWDAAPTAHGKRLRTELATGSGRSSPDAVHRRCAVL